MEDKTIIYLVALFMSIAGIYAIYLSIKGFDRNYQFKKASSSILFKILGYTGYRFFLFFVGGGLLFFPILLLSIKLGNSETAAVKTDRIEVFSKHTDASGETEMSVNGNLAQINSDVQNNFQNMNNNVFKISFKNNHIEKVPDFLWQLKNLQEIDFENNDINSLPIEKLKALANLKIVNIKNNPLSKEILKELESLQNIQLIK